MKASLIALTAVLLAGEAWGAPVQPPVVLMSQPPCGLDHMRGPHGERICTQWRQDGDLMDTDQMWRNTGKIVVGYERPLRPGWRPMWSAPHDGTVIEVRNDNSMAASYSLMKWRGDAGMEWIDPQQCGPEIGGGCVGFDDASPCFSWRPYRGAVSAYKAHDDERAHLHDRYPLADACHGRAFP